MIDKPFYLEHSALAITERCVLKCKLCQTYIPYHNDPQDMDLETLSRILERYFSLVDSVSYFCLTGGEPLLRKDLLAVLELVHTYSNQILKSVDFVTNGALMIAPQVIDFLTANRDKSRVIISDYGKYSPQAGDLEKKLLDAGVSVRVEHYHGKDLLHGGWIDFRDHSLKHITRADRDRQGASCFFKNKRNYTIRKNELHNCARSYWRMLQNIIPRNPEEYIDLLDTSESVPQQREKLRKLHSLVSVTSCAYCVGATDKTERHVPAEQL